MTKTQKPLAFSAPGSKKQKIIMYTWSRFWFSGFVSYFFLSAMTRREKQHWKSNSFHWAFGEGCILAAACQQHHLVGVNTEGGNRRGSCWHGYSGHCCQSQDWSLPGGLSSKTSRKPTQIPAGSHQQHPADLCHKGTKRSGPWLLLCCPYITLLLQPRRSPLNYKFF